MKITILLLISVVATFVDISLSLTPAQQIEVDELVESVFMDYNRIPGVGLTIVENRGATIYVKGYGFQDMESGIPANSRTKFCIASISKTFGATLLMKVLSEKFPELGSRALDVPIKQLHPTGNFTFSDRYRSESMSFRDLLSHRHGVATESLGSSAGAYPDIEEYIYRSRYAKEVGPFRAYPEYSNTFYVLLGNILAEIAEMRYETLLQNLFADIGMTESTFVTKTGDYESLLGMAKGYYLKDGEVLKYNMSLINRIFLAPSAGGIITTANDMAKYMSFHLNLGKVGETQVIPEEAMKWMRQSAYSLDGMTFKTPESNLVQGVYALGTGFQLGAVNGYAYMAHSGQFTPFMCEMRVYPEIGLGTFSVNNGPVNLYPSPFGHPFLHEEIVRIVTGGQSKNEPYQKPSGNFVPKPKKTNLSRCDKDVKALDQGTLPGIFGHAVEGELEITNPNGTLYMRYGEWATGYLTTYPDVPNGFLINWDTDLVQEIYFNSGVFVDMIAQFSDVDTLNLHLSGAMWEFKRNVTLISLPEIPWSENSCGPETG